MKTLPPFLVAAAASGSQKPLLRRLHRARKRMVSAVEATGSIRLGNYLGAIKNWIALQVPEPLIPPAGARIMSLTDDLSKMSKSAPSDWFQINLLDPKDTKKSAARLSHFRVLYSLEFDSPEHPECNNLLSIYQLISSKTKRFTMRKVHHEEIISDPAYLDAVLAEGATKAAAIADATLDNVYQAMGFLQR